MQDILRTIARENYRRSGYITHPGRERRTRWIFSAPPRSPFLETNAVLGALRRRERASRRSLGLERPEPVSLFKFLFHALVRR